MHKARMAETRNLALRNSAAHKLKVDSDPETQIHHSGVG